MIYIKPLFQDCLWKKHFGIECPGCGIQRAFECLLHGDIFGSVSLYPALLPSLAMLVYLGLHLRFSFRRGAKVLVWMFTLNVIIITVNYIIKIIHLI